MAVGGVFWEIIRFYDNRIYRPARNSWKFMTCVNNEKAMSGGAARNPSTRLLPPIKNPLFNPNDDVDEVCVGSVVGLLELVYQSVDFQYFYKFLLRFSFYDRATNRNDLVRDEDSEPFLVCFPPVIEMLLQVVVMTNSLKETRVESRPWQLPMLVDLNRVLHRKKTEHLVFLWGQSLKKKRLKLGQESLTHTIHDNIHCNLNSLVTSITTLK